MPVLDSTSPLTTLVSRSAPATNATSAALQVVCAWPVSGQYGPGSRVLYYVLIAACVFARKADWLKGACLAAALLFPAVAALHGILLAAIHIHDAVDMDVYGAFQLCSIGILAAPVTVRLSRTYFFDPGRNLIFVWTLLILAGLLSLTVEFFRIKTTPCTHDNFGKPVFFNTGNFTYSTETSLCGLTCSVDDGPTSPMRRGSANNIYVIPVPDKLTFGTATLLAAACCIPAILSLVSMWNKILEINWKTRFGNKKEEEQTDVPIEGTNGATIEKIRGVNALVSLFLSAVEIPVFVASILAILIMGERNFFSHQVRFQTEPIASVGQWAPIVGTGLAVLGSLYILLASGGKPLETTKEQASEKPSVQHHCNCSAQQGGTGSGSISSHSMTPPAATLIQSSSSNGGEGTSNRIVRTTSLFTTTDAGNRRKVAKTLSAIATYLGTAAPGRFDDSDFKHGKALDFPEIPGEEQRNPDLHRVREQYNAMRDDDGNVTPMSRVPSRAGSFIGSIGSRASMERSPTFPVTTSTNSPHDRISFEVPNPSSSSFDPNGRMPRQRRDTLEVPAPVHHHHTRNTNSVPSIEVVPNSQNSPTIVVSSDLGPSSSAQPQSSTASIPSLPSEPLPKPPTAAFPPST